MQITYDPTKNERNIRERGLSFDEAVGFRWGDASVDEDTRKPYPERRFVAIGYLDNRLHVLCFAETELGIRVISFRKANKREARDHDKTLTID
jgi:uncharacterized DUF497 family protein